MTAKITIKDVAARAGVAVKTVSRVLNDEPNVTGPVRERVLKAVDELGYVPSMAARRMGGTRSYLLIAFNDRRNTLNNWASGRGNDWIDQMLFGAMTACEARGYRFMFELIDPADDQLERRVSGVLAALQPDGVILTPPHSENPALMEMLSRRRVRFVCMGAPGLGLGHGVFMDDRRAAADAVRHLLNLKRRRVAFISGSPRFAASRARQDGYRDALEEQGLFCDPALVREGDFTFESGVAAAEALLTLPEPPDAVLASNDEMALAVLHVAHRRGVAAPADLAVVSFDDSPGVRLSVPPLTSIRQPIAEMAGKAAEILIAASKGDEAPVQDHLTPYRLVVRASTAALP